MRREKFCRSLSLGFISILGVLLLMGCGAKVEKRELPVVEIKEERPSIVHSPEAILARGRLKVGISIDRGPYSLLNASSYMEGFDAELARTFAMDLLGDSEAVDFFFYNEGTKEEQLLEGKVDLVFSMSQWKDRPMEEVTFFPIMKADISVVSKEKSKIEKLEDLSGKTLVVIQNTPAQFLFSTSYPDIKLKEVVNFQEAYDLLVAGEVTGMAIDSPQALAWALSNEGYQVSIPSLGYPYQLGLGIDKKEELLGTWLREELDKVKVEGYLDSLYSQFLDPIYKEKVNSQSKFQ